MTQTEKTELLIARFLDGTTTNAEEQQLYSYFEAGNVAPHLKKYADMFGWYAGGMTEPLPQQPAEKTHRLKAKLMRAAGIAAAVLLLFGVAHAYHSHTQRQRLYAIYEGSYIICDGKKITDIEKILPQLKRLELDATETGEWTDSIANMTPEEIFERM